MTPERESFTRIRSQEERIGELEDLVQKQSANNERLTSIIEAREREISDYQGAAKRLAELLADAWWVEAAQLLIKLRNWPTLTTPLFETHE